MRGEPELMAEAMLASMANVKLADLLKVLDSKLRFEVTFEGTPLVIDVHLKPNEILARIKVVENGD